MCELCHIVCLVELGRIDFVDGIGVDVELGAIVALDEQAGVGQLLNHPATHKGGGGIAQPYIALAGEVALAVDEAAHVWAGGVGVVGDEGRGEGADGGAVAVRGGADVAHGGVGRRRGWGRGRSRRRGRRKGAVARGACKGATMVVRGCAHCRECRGEWLVTRETGGGCEGPIFPWLVGTTEAALPLCGSRRE